MRERLLRTAYELFTVHGLNSVGVDRIVAEAAVAKATLYRLFGSKDELVVAVLDRHEELWIRGWLAREAERRAGTPSERLLALFEAFEEWLRQEDYHGCLFMNSLLETHERSSLVSAAARAGLGNLHHLLLTIAGEAGLREAEEISHRLQLLMHGAIVAAVEGHWAVVEAARAEAVRSIREAHD